MPDEMTHERCSELLAAYAGGRLDASEQAAVEHHVGGCPDCSAELDAVRALSADGDAPLSELERARLERGIAWELGDLIPSRPERSRVWTRLAQGLGAAALLAIVGVGIAQLGTGQSGGNDSGAAVGVPGAVNDGGGGGAEAGTDTAAGNADAMAPLPGPSFQRHTIALTDAKLAHLGERSAQFRSFSAAYSAADAVKLKDDYVRRLAADAPTGIQQDQVRECADQVFDSTQSYSLLPAYAADARLDGKDALVLGFAWTDKPEGPLDQYMLWVWPVTGCGAQDVPLDYSAGPIGKK
jgi:putative zinc finger protein